MPTTYAAAQAEIIIEIERITETGAEPNIETLEIGDLIRVTVSFVNFPGVMSIHPSLSFNPNILQVVHPVTKEDLHTDVWLNGWHLNPDLRFFVPGTAIGGEPGEYNFGGVIPPAIPNFPFVNNVTGLIGMLINSPGFAPAPINGRQTMYAVYMRAIAAGSTNIRMSSRADGPAPGNNATNWFHDPNLYTTHGTTPQYTDPYVSFVIAPYISPLVLLPESQAEIFRYSDGKRITNFEQLSGGNEIFASLDRTGINESARLFLAVFDNGRFIASQNTNEEQTQNIRLPDDIQNVTIKVFVWEDLGTMNPIFRQIILKINA